MTRADFIAILALAAFPAGLAGCTPELGDKCVLSTDCSLRGDRTCDISQPGGYCTIRDCRPNGCPDDGACVLFEPTIPGCGFDSRGRSRVARSYCMAFCEENADCREGYICADPKSAPWNAVILDGNTNKRVCILPPSGGAAASSSADTSEELPICRPVVIDAGFIDAHSAYDAGGTDAALDATVDASLDATPDGGVTDAASDGEVDAGPSDASDAG